MSNVIDDGGPAFPVPNIDDHGQSWPPIPGMSLRDYFAGQALVGMETWSPLSGTDAVVATQQQRQMARALWAYEQADAMLAARKDRTP